MDVLNEKRCKKFESLFRYFVFFYLRCPFYFIINYNKKEWLSDLSENCKNELLNEKLNQNKLF